MTLKTYSGTCARDFCEKVLDSVKSWHFENSISLPFNFWVSISENKHCTGDLSATFFNLLKSRWKFHCCTIGGETNLKQLGHSFWPDHSHRSLAYKVILYPEEIKGIVQYLVLENGWGEKQGNPKLGLFENCRGDNLESEKGVNFAASGWDTALHWRTQAGCHKLVSACKIKVEDLIRPRVDSSNF